MTPIAVVDAFAHVPFSGNPAGVCLLEGPADEEWMRRVAAEVRHSETAFLAPNGEGYALRWFTPTVEVDLCGHATLASAHWLWETGRLAPDAPARFETKSGILICRRAAAEEPEPLPVGEIVMDFPAEVCEPENNPAIDRLTGGRAVVVAGNRMDWLVELATEKDVQCFSPDEAAVAALGRRGLIVTARAHRSDADFVSRFFAPQSGVAEDPVTGSAHCCLGPYWAHKLGKEEVTGYQSSARGGYVRVRDRGNRVDLIGRAVTVLQGELKA